MPESKKTKLELAIEIMLNELSCQVDKGGLPACFHSLRVMISPSLTTEDERIVAILHDVLEDGSDPDSASYEIEMLFGKTVLDAVRMLTKPEHLKGISGYCKYLTNLVVSSSTPAGKLALAVKKADMADNSSLERLAQLPTERERERLQRKYAIGKKILGIN